MIHDGDYYIIVDNYNILSLLDKIEQNIILFTTEISHDTILCSQDLWARILILQRIWRYYQVGRIAHVGFSQISTEEYLVVRKRVPSRTERPSVREPGNNGNHAPIGQSTERLL